MLNLIRKNGDLRFPYDFTNEEQLVQGLSKNQHWT